MSLKRYKIIKCFNIIFENIFAPISNILSLNENILLKKFI